MLKIKQALKENLLEGRNQIQKYKINLKAFTEGKEAKGIVIAFDSSATSADKLIEYQELKINIDHTSQSGTGSEVISSPEKKAGPSGNKRPSDHGLEGITPLSPECPTKKPRSKRSIGMLCVDSRDEEKITEEEKERRIKELFRADNIVEKVNNIKFYDQLFKISQQVSKGVDSDVETEIGNFKDKIKDLDLDSIDPEIGDIIKEIKTNIENKEEIKNILKRSGVAEKIGKVAEGAGLAYTVFLVGKHIANGDIEGLGYDALNLWVMPKIGEKVSGQILKLSAKLDSQMLKGVAPAIGRAIGNFAAFLGLAESIKALKNATDPIDIKMADLNIATNSIFITADIPAIVTETMAAAEISTGVVGEFAGPIGAAVSVAVIIISQFVEAEFALEKLEEQINLTDQEKHEFYWDFFLDQKIPDYIERDIEAKEIYKQYISNVIGRFNGNYDKIAISLPAILVTKEEYATTAHSRVKRQYFGGTGVGMMLADSLCRSKTRTVDNKFDFKQATSIAYVYRLYNAYLHHNSRIIPNTIEDYNAICGPLDNNIAAQVVSIKNLANLPSGESCENKSQYNNMLLSKTVEKWFLQKYPSNYDCYNAVLYERSNTAEP